MSLESFVSRLRKVNDELMTITSLGKIQDMSDKRSKKCACPHHRSSSVSRCPAKCNTNVREKKKHCRPSRECPRLCLCPHEPEDTDDDKKSRSENSPHREKSKENEPTKKFHRDDKPKEMTESLEDRELEKRNLELEETLKNINCSVSCLREEGEKQATCLKESLEKARKEANLAARSRNLAMDLAKQSREQTDLVKASREEILKQMNDVRCKNTQLQCECEDLRCHLQEITDNEAKKKAEFDERVYKVQCASKSKETTLANENCELEKTVKMQKKRICDLTLICTKQRDLLRKNEECISMKTAQLTEAGNKIRSLSCECRQMQEQIENLQCRLKEESIARENMRKKLDERQDNCDCELQIKNKIIEDHVETIKKLKKLLQDSEKMAHQAACEFESLRDELQSLKQINKSLKTALDEAEARTSDESEFCDRCNVLDARINNLEEQKQKAMMAAKIAAAKLCKTTAEYERQLDCKKRQNDYMNNLVERQKTEIQLLKKEILCVKEFRSRRSNDFIEQN